MKPAMPSFAARLSLALMILGLGCQPTSFASLEIYDAVIASEHDGGAGELPYAAALTTPAVFDGSNAAPFDFGSLTGPSTIELIIEGDPVAGGQNGYIGQGSNAGNSLRFEQWDDTGTLGFTRAGIADYDLGVPSPTEPSHVTYRWDGAGTMELFVDGALSGTVAEATFEMPTGAGLIGNVSDGGGEGMIGTIHRITTYDSPLDDATIQKHANVWLATGDPSIQVPGSTSLSLDGSVQALGLTVFNAGQENILTVSGVEINGPDATKFTINTPTPFDVDPTGQVVLEFTFDPMGASGTVAATFTIFSNDLINDEVTVELSGLIRDPQIAVAAEFDFGVTNVEVTEMIEVQNLGANQALTISSYGISGPDADKFSVTGPLSIPANSSADIEVTFTPGGFVGSYDAQLGINSNDPGLELALVALNAIEPLEGGFLSAYDSVIAADHGGGTGPIPHNSALTVPSFLDLTNSTAFDFGSVTGDATFEFIVEGDPVGGGQDGFLAVGENATFSLRYEQWDDTGALGFTHGGVEDYLFQPENDATLLNSPETATHIAYLWQLATQTMSLYVDGVFAGTHIGSAFEMPNGQGVLGNNAAGTEGMLGTIHRATIYDTDIGAENVLRHALAFTSGASGSGFKIISVDLKPDDGILTIVWDSIPNAFYAIDRSKDLKDWGAEVEDGILATETTTSRDIALPEGETRVYFRVRRQVNN